MGIPPKRKGAKADIPASYGGASPMTIVYVLKSVRFSNKYYIGMTDDLEPRLKEHNAGRSFHTAKWRPWKITVSISFEDRARAVQFERYLKSGSGRAFAKRHF
ncbi:MAG: GIY-YIG nuclease family protein [Planctomycetes bacterium]|nr:GIY-YIG nuclease family protein [Planctomycetota bacterium]